MSALNLKTLPRAFVDPSLALAGWVNPLVAAVLMPASSLINLALATAGMRGAFRDDGPAAR